MDPVLGAVLGGRGGRWLASATAGALAFWCLGVLALADVPWSAPAPAACSTPASQAWCVLRDRTGLLAAAWIVLGALVVIGSTAVAAHLTGPVLSAVAGERWPRRWGAERVTGRLMRRQRCKRVRLAARALAGGSEVADLLWYPTGPGALRPTRAGNAFAALAQRAQRRHGLDLAACWPLLEEVLDEATRGRLESASGMLGRRVDALVWSVGSLVWLPWLPGRLRAALLIVLVVLVPLVWSGLNAAVIRYCAAVEALVVAHRHTLYRAAGLPLPESTDREPAQGQELTAYLTRFAAVPTAPLTWTEPK